MKKVIKLFLLIVLFNVMIINVNAKGNPYPKYEQSAFGGKIINCTWYAWQQAKDNTGVELPLWYNVETWYSKAAKAGYSVGKEPRAKSIMVWNYGEGYGGHVAYVTAVNGTAVSYNEGGSPMTESGINSDTMTLDDMSWFLVGFIYLDNVPTKAPVQENPAQTTPTKPKTEPKPKEEVKKSSNNNLSSLKIEGIDFEFNKDTLEYNLEVDNNVDKIKVEAQKEDSKASIEGELEKDLVVGQNTITIKVIAEDKSEKAYTLDIKRKDNNANLSSLTISDINFEFDKDKLEYELEVGNETTSVNITGTLESETAKAEGFKDYNLNEGDNKIDLIVTAEDNTEKIYKLNIIREAKEEKKISKKNGILISLGIATGVVVIFIVIYELIIKKKKNK